MAKRKASKKPTVRAVGSHEYRFDQNVGGAVSVTFPAPGAGAHWVIMGVAASYDGSSSGGVWSITGLEDTFEHYIPGARNNDPPTAGSLAVGLPGLDNTPITVAFPAGDGGTVVRLSVRARKVLTGHLNRVFQSR